MSDNLFAFLHARFGTAGERPLIETPDGVALTGADIVARTGRLANLFAALGVAPGDRIAAQTEKSVDALLVYLAALRLGAIYLPLNPAYTPAELAYFLGDAEPALFVAAPEREAALAPVARAAGVRHLLTLGSTGGGTGGGAGERSLLPAAAAHSADFEDVPRGTDDLAAILYTSGTTGRSKGAMLSIGNLRSNTETLERVWRFTAEDRLLHALPIFHTHGLFVASNLVLATAGSMIFLPRFDAAELVRLMPRATALMGVPTFYTRLLAEPGFTRAAAAHMRLFISGSAPLSAQTHRDFRARTGHAILERYGMTETNMNTSNPYDGDRVPGSVGPALPGVELRITDPETGAVLDDPGAVGGIEVRGPNVFKGYWRMPEKTAEDIRPDGFFRTGDVGFIDARGYVHIAGRAKDLIISGGLNVYPAEVEDAIDALPGVAESAVIGVPHPDLGEAAVAVVTPAGAAPSEESIVAALGERLARFKQPKRILFVDALPRNAMGKVQKALLRERHRDLFADG